MLGLHLLVTSEALFSDNVPPRLLLRSLSCQRPGTPDTVHCIACSLYSIRNLEQRDVHWPLSVLAFSHNVIQVSLR